MLETTQIVVVTTEVFMKADRRFKTLIYWIILLSYIFFMYYIWAQLKRELKESKYGAPIQKVE